MKITKPNKEDLDAAWEAVVLDACGMFFGLVVVLVAFLAILGVVK
ncbi:hypothetical protein [Neisseria sp. HMSC069H12]|nr:hypothetical protein [Neisseria sp. HMSC069H12]